MESVNNSIKEEESDPSTEFVTLYEILEENTLHSEIADAIEKVGISGWDRYGRYLENSKPGRVKSSVAIDALNALAEDYAWCREDHYPEGREPRDIKYTHTSNLFNFGWIRSKKPEFTVIEKDSARSQKPRGYSPKERNNHLKVIEMFLKILIPTEADKALRVHFKSQGGLIKFIQEKFGDTPGTSKRHLEDVFAEANVSDI